MRIIVSVFLFIFFSSCEKKSKIDEGFYCLSNHLVYEDSVSNEENSKRSNNILICIKNDSLNYWGDISFWKKSEKLNTKEVNDTVFLNNGVFLDENNVCYINKDKSVRKFQKLNISCELKAPKEINFNDKNNCVSNEIRRLRRNHIFSGRYKLNYKNVEFFEDGSVKGLDYFNNYDVYFRGGTNFPFKGTNLISTNNGVWNCKIKGNKYFFSRFEDKRNEVDEIVMSKTKFELIKL